MNVLKMGTHTDSVDPDEMPRAATHWGRDFSNFGVAGRHCHESGQIHCLIV